MIGPQALIQVIQLGYAAVASRLLSPSDFGSYATALAAVGLLGLFANVGLDAAMSRSAEQSAAETRSVATFAVIVGGFLGVVTFALAQPWATLWGDSSAAGIIRVMALGVALVPLSAVVSGISRNRGRFRQLAILTATLLIAGMVVSVFGLWLWGSPLFLPVPGVAVQCGVPLLSSIAIGDWLLPGRLKRSSLHHVKFGGKALATNLFEYSGWMVLQFAVSRGLGAASLGQLNRAYVFSAAPLQGINSSLAMVLYPEFGERFDPDRGPAKLQRAAVLSSWLGCILGPLVGAAAFLLIPVVLGAEWQEAATISVVLAVAAGAAVSATPLTSYMQASNQFRTYWRIQAWTTLIYVCGAAYLLVAGNLMAAAMTFFAVNVARWLIVAAVAVRRKTVTMAYLKEIAVAAMVGSAILSSGLGIHWLSADSQAAATISLCVTAVLAAIVWLLRGVTSISPLVRDALFVVSTDSADDNGMPSQ